MAAPQPQPQPHNDETAYREAFGAALVAAYADALGGWRLAYSRALAKVGPYPAWDGGEALRGGVLHAVADAHGWQV